MQERTFLRKAGFYTPDTQFPGMYSSLGYHRQLLTTGKERQRRQIEKTSQRFYLACLRFLHHFPFPGTFKLLFFFLASQCLYMGAHSILNYYVLLYFLRSLHLSFFRAPILTSFQPFETCCGLSSTSELKS